MNSRTRKCFRILSRPCSSSGTSVSASIQPLSPSAMQKLFCGNLEVPSASDLRVISERQLECDIDDIVGIEAGRCRHGFPRAFVRQPITPTSINSGFMRLSCPYLVKEIDRLELTSGVDSIRVLNEDVAASPTLQTSFRKINYGHMHVRAELLAHNSIYIELVEKMKIMEDRAHEKESAGAATTAAGRESRLVDRVNATSVAGIRRLVNQVTHR
jgi:hypothetical protein